MECKCNSNKWIRGGMASLISFFLLAATLPNTGGMIEGPPHHGMWQCGPFMFYPVAFFGVVGIVVVPTACTLFGIVRGNVFEFVGWILFGVFFLLLLMA
jgi:hypothetical protein